MNANAADPDPALSLEEVALLVGDVNVQEETARRLPRFIRTDPRCAEHVETLEWMARDAGLDPAEILEDELEPYFHTLILVARVRRKEDPKLNEVLERLEQAWAQAQEQEALVDGLAARLLEYPRDVAEQLLRQAAREYRSRLDQTRQPREVEE